MSAPAAELAAPQAPLSNRAEEIRDAIACLMLDGEVRELRIPKAGRFRTVSGYFADLDALAAAAEEWDGSGAGVYVTLNPVAPALLARAENRARPYAESTTTDGDVEHRAHLLVDLDPVRPSGIASSQAEHDAALRRMDAVRADLRAQGWPEPVAVTTGNGAALWYALNLPNDAASTALVNGALQALAFRYSDDAVGIDTSVGNAARIARIPGTLNCKGDDTAERPHRRAAVLAAPPEREPVARELLEALAAQRPEEPRGNGSAERFDIDTFVERYLASYTVRSGSWQGGRRWRLRCPLSDAHDDDGAYIIQHASGALSAGCAHDSCSWGWNDLREHFEPRTRREQAQHAAHSDRTHGSDSERNHGADPDADAPEPLLVRLHDVESERVEWLWSGRLPRGKVVVLDGDPGLGKSTLTLDLAARVSTGRPMPDGAPSVQGGVVIASAEDGLADTIRPRLDAAMAEPSRIVAFEGVRAPDGTRAPLTLPDDVRHLEAAIRKVGAVLVVLDPLMAFLGGEVNAHRDQHVRRALAPVAGIAEATGACVLLVRHLNKGGGGNAVYRGGGSIGIIGAARAGLLVAADPDDPERRVLAVSKSNLAQAPPALGFRLVGSESGVAALDWLGATKHRNEDLLDVPGDRAERSARDDAKAFLREALAHGPRPVKDLQREAKDAGLGWRGVERAKADLGVRAGKQHFTGGWAWSLPAREGSAEGRTEDRQGS